MNGIEACYCLNASLLLKKKKKQTGFMKVTKGFQRCLSKMQCLYYIFPERPEFL